MHFIATVILAATTCVVSGAASARDLYVDPLHGTATGSGSASSPYATLWQASAAARPCDTVHALATAPLYSQGIGGVHGTAACPIVFTGQNAGYPLTALMQADPTQDRATLILYDDTYVTIAGFHVYGHADGPGGGIAISSPDTAHVSHHILITNNYVQDAGGGGILAFESDYVTISHNVVWNTARYTQFARGSGISVVASHDIDANTGPKIIIDANRVYGNTNVPWCPGDAGASLAACISHSDSDGSGIIADANGIKWTYPTGTSPDAQETPYHGRIRITNNLVFGNGGRGVHIFRSSHADVYANSLVMNNQDPYNQYAYPGELNITESTDDSVANNLLYTRGGLGFQGTPRVCATFGPWVGVSTYDGHDPTVRPVTMTRNWCYALAPIAGAPGVWAYPGLAQVTVSGMLYGAPQLRHPAADASADLRPVPGSPLLGAALPAAGMPVGDFMGAWRGARTAIGAYDNASD